jgi:hypothetical protein
MPRMTLATRYRSASWVIRCYGISSLALACGSIPTTAAHQTREQPHPRTCCSSRPMTGRHACTRSSLNGSTQHKWSLRVRRPTNQTRHAAARCLPESAIDKGQVALLQLWLEPWRRHLSTAARRHPFIKPMHAWTSSGAGGVHQPR